MENEKVKYLIDMINDMDLTNKLRLAICMSDSSCTNLKYDKPEMYKYFDSMLICVYPNYISGCFHRRKALLEYLIGQKYVDLLFEQLD